MKTKGIGFCSGFLNGDRRYGFYRKNETPRFASRCTGTFECTVNPDAEEVNLIATYFYEFQPVGTARRNIVVGKSSREADHKTDDEEKDAASILMASLRRKVKSI